MTLSSPTPKNEGPQTPGAAVGEAAAPGQRYARGRDLPPRAVADAQKLVGAIREHGPDVVSHLLLPLCRNDLYALIVSVAAMVPDDYSPAELLAWNDSRYRRPETLPSVNDQPRITPAVLFNGKPLKPHGTHAAWNRHRKAGEDPCDACWHGERAYQRERKRRRDVKVRAA